MKTYITRINGWSLRDKSYYMQHMIAEIAHQLDCREMGIYRYNTESENRESLSARLDGIIAGITRGDLVICQFPTGNGIGFENELVNRLKAYGGRIAIFIHELEALAYEEKQSLLGGTIGLYNQAEVLIVSTYAMRQWLLENGIRKSMKFVVQEMWDYTVGEPVINTPTFKKEIYYTDGESFAGMNDWNYAVPLKLYNVSADKGQNIQNLGVREPYQLFSELSLGGFGLVWYRDEHSRQYMEYSNSFSLARYLSAGIPVIVSEGISHRTLIEENHLGLVVNSLEAAAAAIEKMTGEEYREYVKSVEQFAPALRNGYYTKKCLIEAMQAFYRKDAGRDLIPAKAYQLGECAFSFTVLRESYGGNLALSWSFKGNLDGFLIYNTAGRLIGETRNTYQHYILIKESKTENGFIVKAYVDTLKGRMIVAESMTTYLSARQYEEPKVSLLMAAYNAEDYIARSIDTALAQSLSELEIVIVDDGSTDHTSGIIDWYAEHYSNVVAIHQKNGRTPVARNTGIKYARGNYLGFMDSDDMIHPEMIARLYGSIIANDCDIAVTSIYLVKNSGYEAYIQYPMKENTAITIDEFFRMHFEKGCMFAVIVVNKLYRSSLVKTHLFPTLPCEDNAWTPYILSYADKICYLDDCSYEYDRTIHTSTVSDGLIKKSKDELFLINENAIMFYLKNSNSQRLKILKELARRQLSEMRRAYGNDEYEKLWKQIEESY